MMALKGVDTHLLFEMRVVTLFVVVKGVVTLFVVVVTLFVVVKGVVTLFVVVEAT
jgi:hypothetical protein